MPRLYPRQVTAAAALRTAGAIVAGAAIAWAGHVAWAAVDRSSTPSCSWPVQIRGTATAQQAGLVRCYLQALAQHDAAGLTAVASDIPPTRITKADFSYSALARAGRPTATFTPSPVDSEYVLLTITYADGARQNTGILNMIAMGGPAAWRMDIGTPVSPGPDIPPAEASPASSSR